MLSDERFYLHRYSDPIQRHIWEYSLRNTTCLYPAPRRDPIFTPIFTSFFGAGFAATTTGAFVVKAAVAIATTALSIGLQALLAPKPPKPEDGKAPKTQGIPYRFWAVGRNRMAGAYVMWESRQQWLYAVQAIAGHPIKSVNRYWLHDDEVSIDENNQTIISGSRYRNRVYIYHRLGAVPETPYEDIVDAFADGDPSERAWTDDHRGDGQSSIAMRVKSDNPEAQAKVFPYGPPSLSVEYDGAYVFDFRIDTDPSNEDAWVWSRNSALILCWHQCFNPFGHNRDYETAILPVIDMWQEEADVCDEDVPLAGGGSEKRYETNGFDSSENDPKAGTNAILASCDGWICERGDGALLFICGKFREKYVATITDADILGFTVHYDVLPEDEINRLKPKFTYPEIDYGTAETDCFEDLDAIQTARRVLAEDADYRFCHKWRQARRLGIRDWRRISLRTSGSLELRLSAINSVYTRWTRMETPLSLPRLDGKLIENRKSVLALLQGGFRMDFTLHPDNIDDWNPETDEGRAPPVPVKPSVSDVVTPVINSVQAVAKGSSVFLKVKIEDPDDDSLTPLTRYRLEDDGGSPGEWVEQQYPDADPVTEGPDSFIYLNTNVVPSDQEIEVQAAFKTSKDRGNWSVTTTVTSTTDDVRPAAPTNLDFDDVTNVFSARAANTTSSQGRTAYLIFKIGTTSQSYADATEIDKLAAQPGDVRYVDVTPVSGATRRLWTASENISGLLCLTPSYIDETFP